MLVIRSRMAFAALLFTPAIIQSGEVKPDTLKAWDDRIQTAESRSRCASPFLWADQTPNLKERLLKGEIVAATIDGKHPESVPHGLIHDWIGAVFIPNVGLGDVLAVVRDYDRFSEYYGPTIRAGRLLFRGEQSESFQLQYVKRVLFVTAALNADYDVRYDRVDERRLYSAARSTCIQEIRNYGEPDERKLPCNDGSGFIWRMYSISKFEARDQGVYVEQESIALTRGIPVSLRWLIEPVVEHLSKELVVTSLRQTRDAVSIAHPVE